MASGIEKFITKVCVQPAIYWQRAGEDGYGKGTFSSPQQVYVRWENATEVILDKDGKETISIAIILTPTDLSQEGMIKLGTLGDLDSDELNNPYTAGAFEIAKYEKIPLFKRANAFVRKVYLSKGRNL